jgi:hypothetical protein
LATLRRGGEYSQTPLPHRPNATAPRQDLPLVSPGLIASANLAEAARRISLDLKLTLLYRRCER